LTTALVSPAALAQPSYPATVDVFGGVNGDGPGGGLELMAPFAEGEGSLLFGLARGSLWDETGAGGVGLGYRSQLFPGFILGGYGMVDYHHGASNEGYFQGVLGLEALTESFDFRINGYLPEDDETTLANVIGAAPPPPPGVMVGDIVIVDHEIGIVTGASAGSAGFHRAFEQPLPGVDAEIGYRLPVPGHDFRIFLGAFHFEGGNDYENVTGPKARAEWRIHDLDLFGNNSRLTLEAGLRDDDVRGTDASAGLRIRIPFGGVPSNQRGHELAGLDQRMLDPIRREDHIVMGEREEMQAGSPGGVTIDAVMAVETGNEITSIWFADGAGGGDGTMGNETDLATAVSDPGAGDQAGRLIVAYGGSGDLTGNVTLATDQILLGGSTTLAISDLSTGTVTAVYDPAGARPMIVDASSHTVKIVTLADGAFVTGIDLTGSNDGVQTTFDDAALYGNGADNLLLRDIAVSNAGNALVLEGGMGARVEQFTASASYADVIAAQTSAIHFRGATGADLVDLTISGYTRGVDFQAGSSGTIRTASITNVGGGIRLDSSSADLGGTAPADNITIRDSQAGIEIQNSTNVTATNIDIDNASVRGIIVATSSAVILDDFTISNSDGNGLMIVGTPMVAGAARAVVARNGTLANNGGGPVALADLFVSGSDVELTDITSSGYTPTIANQPAVFLSQAIDVEMNNVDVSGAGGPSSGITVANNSQDIVITGSDVTNVAGFGVILSQVDNVTFQGDGGTPFNIQNTGSTGLLIVDARNTLVENGVITNTGGSSAYLDAGGILVQGVVGKVTQVALRNIDVTGADSPNPEAYGVYVIPVGAPTQVDIELTNIHVDGGAGMTTTRGFYFVDSGPTNLSGTGNTTVNVPDACHVLGSPSGSVEINGNSEPGTTC
jgi:hypothetical protein